MASSAPTHVLPQPARATTHRVARLGWLVLAGLVGCSSSLEGQSGGEGSGPGFGACDGAQVAFHGRVIEAEADVVRVEVVAPLADDGAFDSGLVGSVLAGPVARDTPVQPQAGERVIALYRTQVGTNTANEWARSCDAYASCIDRCEEAFEAHPCRDQAADWDTLWPRCESACVVEALRVCPSKADGATQPSGVLRLLAPDEPVYADSAGRFVQDGSVATWMLEDLEALGAAAGIACLTAWQPAPGHSSWPDAGSAGPLGASWGDERDCRGPSSP